MKLEEAINLIFEKNCVLFLGAGFSYKATNSLEEEMPLAGDLCKILDEESGEDSDGDLSLASRSYIDIKGEYQLVELLKNTFTAIDLKDFQEEFGKYVWKRIYTTNYDNVYELAVAKNRKRVTAVTLSDHLYDYKDKNGIIVHLNGSVFNLNSASLTSEFKLTDASYLTSDFEQSEWVTLFKNDLADADAVFFIGFSGKSDLDINRILIANDDLRNKTFFVLRPDERPSTIKRLQLFGNVITIGREAFAEKLKQQHANYTPPIIKMERPFLSFRKLELPTIRPDLHDDDISNLFLYGNSNNSLVFYSQLEPEQYPYYIVRDKMEATVSEILNGRRHVLVHSDAGNGKTLFLDGLCLRLLKENYSVYIFHKYTSRLNEEIERICKIQDKKVAIVLENYSSYFDIINAFKLYSTDQTLVLTDRSVRNDMKYPTLTSILSDDFYTLDLNVLTEAEIESLVDIFNHYGLWQELSTYNDNMKKNYFVNKCSNSIRGILLALFRSPSIKERLSGIISSIKKETNYYEAIVVALLNKVYNLELDIDMLSDALGGGYIGDYSFRKNQLVNEFVDFSNQEIKVKSTILAEVLLWDVLDVMTTKKVMVKMFRNFDKKRSFIKYHRALQLLLSYTSLQRVLNKESDHFGIAMRGFFEEIRETGFCKDNPHYWLQYAICKLDENDYTKAKIYFENAFAYAKSKENFDSYQIKNHYARYLLENASNTFLDNYMNIFKEAHSIVIDPVHLRDNKYYPFRVARNYLPFYVQYKSQMSKSEKTFFKNACLKVLQMIEKFYQTNPKYKNRKDVKDAKRSLQQIVGDLI